MEEKTIEQKEKRKQLIKDIITYVAIIVVVILIRVFLFDPVMVEGPSMDTTLKNGEVLILNKNMLVLYLSKSNPLIFVMIAG